jgi:hypothetical protein
LPLFFLCMARSTLFPAFFEYFAIMKRFMATRVKKLCPSERNG